MGKRILNLYIDDELISLAKKEGLNISQFVEQQLKNRVDLMPKGKNYDEIVKNIKDKQKLLETELQNTINEQQEIKKKEPNKKHELSDKLKNEL